MKMRRIVSAESKAGVVMHVSDAVDTETADRVTNIWGFDKIPQLPLTPEQVLGEYKRLGIFGPRIPSASIFKSFRPKRRA